VKEKVDLRFEGEKREERGESREYNHG